MGLNGGRGFAINSAHLGKNGVVSFASRRHRPKIRRPPIHQHRMLADEDAIVKGMVVGKFLNDGKTSGRIKGEDPGAIVICPEAA